MNEVYQDLIEQLARVSERLNYAHHELTDAEIEVRKMRRKLKEYQENKEKK